jgi:hypothetical protein
MGDAVEETDVLFVEEANSGGLGGGLYEGAGMDGSSSSGSVGLMVAISEKGDGEAMLSIKPRDRREAEGSSSSSAVCAA